MLSERTKRAQSASRQSDFLLPRMGKRYGGNEAQKNAQNPSRVRLWKTDQRIHLFRYYVIIVDIGGRRYNGIIRVIRRSYYY